MIFLNDKPGQLCNQLWYQAPLIARALKYNTTLISLYFEDNIHLFENVNRYPRIKFGFTRVNFVDIYIRKFTLNLVRQLPNKLLEIINIKVDKERWRNEIWSEEEFEHKKLMFFTGNGTRRNDVKLLAEFHQEISNIFSPNKKSINKVLLAFSQMPKESVIVGVHIRRGDYDIFFNGLYYFGNNIYSEYMSQIQAMFDKQNQSVTFLICSNEKIDLANFHTFKTFKIKNANSIEDLYGLSICNYIIGPPSTFSMWASFIGKVPLRFLKYKNEQINLQDFSIITAQDTFANGSIFEHVEA